MALRIAAFVIPLGFDTFALAVALGLRGVSMLKPALLFPAFEITMPLIGIAVGYYASRLVERVAVYIGAIVLIGMGLHTLRETLEGEDESATLTFDSVRGIILAGFAISTDEVAIGFPLGVLGLPVVPVLLAIGLQAFVVTVAGILIGRRVSTAIGHRTSRIAGIVAGVAFVILGCYLAAERIVSVGVSIRH